MPEDPAGNLPFTAPKEKLHDRLYRVAVKEHEQRLDDERATYEADHDMVAVQDFDALSKRLHALIWEQPERPCAGNHGPRSTRIVLDVPNEWLMMASWMAQRRVLQSIDRPAAFQASIDEALNRRQIEAAKHQLWWWLNHAFGEELHWLATGSSDLLLKKEVLEAQRRKPAAEDLKDDEVPF